MLPDMTRRTLLLILLVANGGLFALAWFLTPDGETRSSTMFNPLSNAEVDNWYIPWVVLVVTILGSVGVWNVVFPRDHAN